MKNEFQYLFPFEESKMFEKFVTDFFNSLEKTNSYSLYGRSGQNQSGIDVYSTEKKVVIQCKLKNINLQDKKIVSDLLDDFNNDFSSFLEFNKNKENKFNKFILASSFKNDTNLDDKAIELSGEINVEYWSWFKFCQLMPDDIFDKYYSQLQNKMVEYYGRDIENEDPNFKEPINIHKDGSILLDFLNNLETIYSMFEKWYSEIHYIPTHILASYPLFSDGNIGNRSYYYSYSIHTKNKELFNFFNSIEIENSTSVKLTEDKYIGDVKNPKDKIQKILKRLTTNNVHSISYNQQKTDIQLFGEKCNCIVCQLDDYKFETISELFKSEPTDFKELLKYSFTYFRIGDNVKAGELLLKAKEIAVKDKKTLSLFIINYNLEKLKKLNKSFYSNDNEQLIFKNVKIDLDKEFCNSIKGENKEIVKWIYDEKYLKSAKNHFTELTSKIKIEYYNSLKNGYSSNGYVEGLINSYLNLESFVRLNYIMYDVFLEFELTFDIFMEGLYASYAIKNQNFSRLSSFNNWHLSKFLKYGNSEKMIRYFNVYKLDKLQIIENADGINDPITDKILRIIDFANSDNKDIINSFEKNSNYFSNYFRRIYKNSIVLAAQVDFNSDFIEVVAKKIIISIENKFTNYNDIQPIEHFLFRKKDVLSLDVYKSILFASIDNSHFHRIDFWETIADIIDISKKYLKINSKEFIKLKNFVKPKCKECGREHNEMFLIAFHRMVDNIEQKDEIKTLIQQSLDKSFNKELFLSSVIFDVIPNNLDHFDKMIESLALNIKPDVSIVGKPDDFDFKRPNTNDELDSIINVCFKMEINTLETRFKIFKNINHYYDWLLDMKNFDYSYFDPKWITIYGTRFYFKKMYQSQKLKEKLESFIQSSESYNEQNILNDYLNIYVRKSWDFN